jgi:hypothetical protein
MKAFTIENETNNITLHATIQDAEAVANAELFRNEAGFAKLAANWPAARLVEIWNSLPGETQVKKFKDRATAVNRIWKAIQSLGPAAMAAEEPAPVPETAPAPNFPKRLTFPIRKPAKLRSRKRSFRRTLSPPPDTAVAPQTPDVAPEQAPATKKATRAKKAPVAATNASAPREGSKTSQVIAMLKREAGVTLEEIYDRDGLAEAHYAGHDERGRLADEEARACHNQREGWRPAEVLHQSLNQLKIVSSRRRIRPPAAFLVCAPPGRSTVR